MRIPFFDLSRQYDQIKEKVEAAVLDVMRSTQYIEGYQVKLFEKEMAEYLGVKEVITCANGTDSLKIALQAVGVGKGDEVITTAFSFFATAEAIGQVGAIPVFVDILPDTFNIDPVKVRGKITSKTKAILPVHIFGTPADMDELNEIANEYGIPVIEDACQAIGATYKGKRTGSLGTMGCFSFYPTKNLGCFGDGGMISTNDVELANICRSIKAHAAGRQAAIAYEKLTGNKVEEIETVDIDGRDQLYDPLKYFNFFIGENSRLDSIQAAVLNVKLNCLEEYNKRRHKIAEMYEEGLRGCNIETPPVYFQDRQSCFHQFAICVDDKDGFIKYLNNNGIGAGNFYPIPLHKQKAFEKIVSDKLDIAEERCKRTVCLPIFPELEDDEIKYIIDTCVKYKK